MNDPLVFLKRAQDPVWYIQHDTQLRCAQGELPTNCEQVGPLYVSNTHKLGPQYSTRSKNAYHYIYILFKYKTTEIKTHNKTKR
jgi:hypothetical protein